jgi:nitrogen fixation-related uncharacterized protein
MGMSAEKFLLKIVALALCFVFFGAFLYSVKNLQKEKTGTSVYQDNERFQMPHSITLCGWGHYLNPPNMTNWTFQEMEKMRKDFRYMIRAGMFSTNLYRPHNEL